MGYPICVMHVEGVYKAQKKFCLRYCEEVIHNISFNGDDFPFPHEPIIYYDALDLMPEYDQSAVQNIPSSVIDDLHAKGDEIVEKFVAEVERRNVKDLNEIWPPRNLEFIA